MDDKEIFSGEESTEMWDSINRLGGMCADFATAHDALYALACKCQELEAKIKHLTTARFTEDKGEL